MVWIAMYSHVLETGPSAASQPESDSHCLASASPFVGSTVHTSLYPLHQLVPAVHFELPHL